MRRLFWLVMIAAVVALWTCPAAAQMAPAREAGAPSQAGNLKAMETKLKNGDPAGVIREVDEQLPKYNATDLPRACTLRGKARMMAAGPLKDEQKKAMLLSAALDFMRVVTFYPYMDDIIADALQSAQKALADAGDKEGAEAVGKLIAESRAASSE